MILQGQAATTVGPSTTAGPSTTFGPSTGAGPSTPAQERFANSASPIFDLSFCNRTVTHKRKIKDFELCCLVRKEILTKSSYVSNFF